MGDVYWGLHLPLAAGIRRMGIAKAIETGTFFGGGAVQLAALFDEVRSIDRDAVLSTFCQHEYDDVVPNVTFLSGDSPQVLQSILHEDRGPFLFVLDAHWFPSQAFEHDEQPQCALMTELEVIRSFGGCRDGSVVMIDDADMLLGSLPKQFRRGDFPSIVEVLDMLRVGLEAKYVDVCDDVIIAGPPRLKDVVLRYLGARARAGGPSSKAI